MFSGFSMILVTTLYIPETTMPFSILLVTCHGLQSEIPWRWGESNPRPRTRIARLYRFVRPIGVSGPGARGGALSWPVFRYDVRPAPRTARDVSLG
ncbi:hypothetical protein TRIP_E310032 [uncultured Spirochaetota bacterium]|uniref:Uncharacterized protein n=1 Tax=uncultured Spirochaetota bacterium TaxID=460511 RepID=A0A652ZXY8_9SPIR|nr:hypothetical protein TRIP_E310032 [uncultured Spirochaetota bacterium]